MRYDEELVMHGMKSSTVRKLLHNRISTWLESITDESVRKLLARDTVVSGGAIASAMTGEKINDYDIYFLTQEAALAAATYYVNQFNLANPLKVASGVKPYAPAVKTETVENIKGEAEERVVIYMKSAGVAAEGQTPYGYFESMPESDSDEFVGSLAHSLDGPSEIPVEKAEEVASEVTDKKKPKYRPVFLSQNAITLSDRIQVVIRFFGSPEEIHGNYDYVHAMCHYTYSSGELVCPSEALEAMLSKTLVYKGSLYPLASMFRVRKFLERGWRISAGQMLKIAFQISSIDLKDTNILREQLMGVDQAYMHQLIRAIENRDKGVNIDATYLAKLVDTIFE